MTSAALPTIGRIVLYRSRTGAYTVPAIITATVETLNPKGVEAGHIPALSSDRHVHLTVFSPGKPGLRVSADDFVNPSEHPISENVSGCYQEWDVAPAAVWESGDVIGLRATIDGDHGEDLCKHAPGTWAFPRFGPREARDEVLRIAG